MITITGDSVWPRGSVHGDTTAPSLYSIGVGLGRMPRFAGQVRIFYPVMAHTITVACLLNPAHAIYGLLHDAPEAIVGDVHTTWKTDAARHHETDLLERITRMLGLQWPWPQDAIDAVHQADADVLAAEAHVLDHAEAATWWPGADTDPRLEYARGLTHAQSLRASAWLHADTAGRKFERMVRNTIDTARWNESWAKGQVIEA